MLIAVQTRSRRCLAALPLRERPDDDGDGRAPTAPPNYGCEHACRHPRGDPPAPTASTTTATACNGASRRDPVAASHGLSEHSRSGSAANGLDNDGDGQDSRLRRRPRPGDVAGPGCGVAVSHRRTGSRRPSCSCLGGEAGCARRARMGAQANPSCAQRRVTRGPAGAGLIRICGPTSSSFLRIVSRRSCSSWVRQRVDVALDAEPARAPARSSAGAPGRSRCRAGCARRASRRSSRRSCQLAEQVRCPARSGRSTRR